MQAYHNNEELKASTIKAMQDDIAAQRLVKGQYWRSDKGCFVGCVIRGDDHMKFETQIGFPVMIARLADTLFEGLPTQPERDKFAINYLSAPKVGADLSLVGWKFLHWTLIEELPKTVVGEGEIFDNVRKAIARCADVLLPLTKGEKVDKAAADAAARAAANAAADAAADAAARAADAAYAAARAADAAAYAAADAAAYAAAYAAANAAADAAARAAAYAAANAAAYAAARAAADAYQRMAAKLVELMGEAATTGKGGVV